MLRIYWADVSGLSLDVERLALSEYRKEKLLRIQSEQKKRQSLGAELLLMHALKSAYPEISFPFEIKCNEKGKPAFVNIPLCFSLSHSGNYAACAVSDLPVGIDIEHAVICKDAVAKRFFSQHEQEIIISAKDKDKAFAKLWTVKESALKFLGSGLSGGLQNVLVYDDIVLLKPENRKLFIRQFTEGNICFSVCTEKVQQDIQIEKIELNKLEATTVF